MVGKPGERSTRRQFLRQAALGGALLCTWEMAAAAQLRALRVGRYQQGVRLVFDLDRRLSAAPVIRSVGEVLHIELPGIEHGLNRPVVPALGPLQGGAEMNESSAGLVLRLPLRESVRWRSFSLGPGGGASHRLVLDLMPLATTAVESPCLQPVAGAGRPIVVCLDPGHGGHDPGAIGAKGTREKDVVLDVGLSLAQLIRSTPGMRLVMSRNTDRYVPLMDRMHLGLEQRADLFVSIHADAFPERTVCGSTVWALSETGASNAAARWLAKTQNAADPFLGGVQSGIHDPMLSEVLINMTQTAAMNSAAAAADVMIRGLAGVEDLHNATVQHANFVVLRAPDVPSVLVETAFISNPEEEQRLRDPDFRQVLARTLHDAVVAHFVKAPPAHSAWSATRHVLSKGENLASVARRYGLSVEALRLANNLPRGEGQPGEPLRVPMMGA
ncbi:N-acetylmuramoyl-L-alanine amidase [Acidithiobacillus sp.]|uniref:N-acetylmuramoyl-L-alanine amidase family protein n=1 Tax=Acidithiobacillus sp. TaxID=1872118 RepID=UPI0025C5BA0B|nr:N-acetylmuramoyl-L-alanine amidase [Acidithiobacillus sp.]MCK9189088.1 N-acetylmuramoyl-L-alanine amidase [Acidithiobacillus sp.]MCK9359531.1 N-acetylmuramoyl-L-alanine amidase [Acidithiobacillus sp.]